MMQVDVGFSLDCVSLPATSIVPSRKMGELAHLSKKVQQIRSSIEEIGLIEPLSVTQEIKPTGKHMLLDGHVRFHVLGAMGVTAMPCLVAKDDEAYTYNNRVNRLSTIRISPGAPSHTGSVLVTYLWLEGIRRAFSALAWRDRRSPSRTKS